MGSLDVSTDRATCARCGKKYPKVAGYFPASYQDLHKGIGHVPICKQCITIMYEKYLDETDNDEMASTRQMCRKLDLFWSEDVFNTVKPKNIGTSRLITAYISRLCGNAYVGKSYDDTLLIEGALWGNKQSERHDDEPAVDDDLNDDNDLSDIPDETIDFWGKGYSASTYRYLDQKRNEWLSQYPDGYKPTPTEESTIRQLSLLDLDIDRERSEGKPVDKLLSSYTNLIGLLNFKPSQQKNDNNDNALNNTPMGVWAYRYEHSKPIPNKYEPSKLLKYMFVWMGHLCRLLGIKDNKYTRLYEETIKRYTVNKPEYDGDEEDLFAQELEETPMNEDEKIDLEERSNYDSEE